MKTSRIIDISATQNTTHQTQNDEIFWVLNARIIWESSQQVIQLIHQLRDLSIDDINIIQWLKNLWRSWKKVRIKKWFLDIPVQNVFDHIISLWWIADILWKEYHIGISQEDLWTYIFFHDLSELFFVDVPDFTPKELAWRHHLSKEEKKKKEEYYNKLIAQNLPPEIQKQFQKLIIDEEIPPKEKAFIKFIDKAEPIMAIWRYIHLFRESFEIDYFIEIMADFFDNHNIPWFAIDERTLELVNFFQNKENAREFYYMWNWFWMGLEFQHQSTEQVKKLVEIDFMEVC